MVDYFRLSLFVRNPPCLIVRSPLIALPTHTCPVFIISLSLGLTTVLRSLSIRSEPLRKHADVFTMHRWRENIVIGLQCTDVFMWLDIWGHYKDDGNIFDMFCNWLKPFWRQTFSSYSSGNVTFPVKCIYLLWAGVHLI